MECKFCDFAKGDICPERIVYEDDFVMAFKEEKHPLAPFHLLVIPKTHIATGFEINKQNSIYVAKMFEAAAIIANKNQLSGYKLQLNSGAAAGQTVFHLHLHMLSYDKQF